MGAKKNGGTAAGNGAATQTIVQERDLLRFTTAGSVDDGKSTLIGRMLFDSKQIFQDQMDQLESASKLRGEENVNLALLTDGLRSEREQGITIDVAYRYFTTPKRKFIIADTPGHEQYTRNMVTGASTADLAIVLIDARNGVLTQSKRHGIIASLLGIPHVVVAVNKMDLVDYSQERYEEIRAEYQDFARKLSINDIEFIPVSALMGDNVVDKSDKMPWYDGQPLLHYLETVTISGDRNLVDFRFPVQYVVRPHQDFRGFSGRIASGSVRVGEEIVVLPSRQRSKVKGIHFFKEEKEEAFAGESVIITLEDEIDISRGDMIVRSHNIPEVATEFDATLTWMDDQHDLNLNTQYVLQHTSRLTKAYVDDLVYQIDVNTLHREDAETLRLNEIGRVKITSANPIFFDPYDRNRNTGGFVLIDPHDFRTVGAGMIRHASAGTMEELRKEQRRDRLAAAKRGGAGGSGAGGSAPGSEGAAARGGAGAHSSTVGSGAPVAPAAQNIFWDPGYVGLEDRVRRNGHRPKVIWFSGISGSGKSTIAKDLEKKLFDAGKNAVRLDGDNVRHGLNADLAFSREDRRENIRRVGHLARQLYDFGNIVLCTFVSPYAEDRDEVRALFPEGDFIEVYVKVDLEEARRRDPKGLYEKVDNGEIRGFTGVDAPYEAPAHAEVVIDSTSMSVDEAVERLIEVVGE